MRRKLASVATPTLGDSERQVTVRFALGEPSSDGKLISKDAIRALAYQKWEAAGRPWGDGTQFWLEAERELKRGK